MKSNLSHAEQVVRGVLGAGLILLTGLGVLDPMWKAVAVAVGCVAVFTASAGFCPLYRLVAPRPERRTQMQS